MSKKNSVAVITMVLVCSLAVASSASAAARKKGIGVQAEESISGQGYGTAGCGLGSVIFGQKEGMVQIFAATTNASSYNQTFGITSGTSNCQADGGDRASVDAYVEANKLALANDVSRGNGETLDGLSQVLGCKNSPRLGNVLQKNYSRIFPSQSIDSVEVSQAIMSTISADSSLSSTCHS